TRLRNRSSSIREGAPLAALENVTSSRNIRSTLAATFSALSDALAMVGRTAADTITNEMYIWRVDILSPRVRLAESALMHIHLFSSRPLSISQVLCWHAFATKI